MSLHPKYILSKFLVSLCELLDVLSARVFYKLLSIAKRFKPSTETFLDCSRSHLVCPPKIKCVKFFFLFCLGAGATRYWTKLSAGLTGMARSMGCNLS